MSTSGDEDSKTPNEANWAGNGESKEGTPSPVSPVKRPQVAANGIMATAEVVTNAYVASKGAHALVICTEWDEFKYDILSPDQTKTLIC